jgi:hypothetical protein
MPTITPIQTQYAGCLFRSRLEARWAVFFDHLGITWRYEPEGFNLDGQWYLPDFYLPGLDAWYEVKGTKPTEREEDLASKLANGTHKNVFIAWGDIPNNPDDYGLVGRAHSDERDITAFRYVEADNDYPGGCYWDAWHAWCICSACGNIGIEFEGRAARVHPRDSSCPNAESEGRGHAGDHPQILAAYTAARSARFEHGQSG